MATVCTITAASDHRLTPTQIKPKVLHGGAILMARRRYHHLSTTMMIRRRQARQKMFSKDIGILRNGWIQDGCIPNRRVEFAQVPQLHRIVDVAMGQRPGLGCQYRMIRCQANGRDSILVVVVAVIQMDSGNGPSRRCKGSTVEDT